MAAGHLDNSANAIWFQPDFDFSNQEEFDFSNQEEIVGGCGCAGPSLQVVPDFFRTSWRLRNN
jgi:hypothetical protein